VNSDNIVLQKPYYGTLVLFKAGISRPTTIITKEANEYIIHVLAVTRRINELLIAGTLL
jgi:hypothetical protein